MSDMLKVFEAWTDIAFFAKLISIVHIDFENTRIFPITCGIQMVSNIDF